MDFDWQIWITVGVVLAVLEIFTATFFILWFAVGAALIGGLALLVPGLSPATQMTAWVVLSLLMTLWRQFMRPRPAKVASR